MTFSRWLSIISWLVYWFRTSVLSRYRSVYSSLASLICWTWSPLGCWFFSFMMWVICLDTWSKCTFYPYTSSLHTNNPSLGMEGYLCCNDWFSRAVDTPYKYATMACYFNLLFCWAFFRLYAFFTGPFFAFLHFALRCSDSPCLGHASFWNPRTRVFRLHDGRSTPIPLCQFFLNLLH